MFYLYLKFSWVFLTYIFRHELWEKHLLMEKTEIKGF